MGLAATVAVAVASEVEAAGGVTVGDGCGVGDAGGGLAGSGFAGSPGVAALRAGVAIATLPTGVGVIVGWVECGTGVLPPSP
jgi:hypothetical protein